jgi:hypothetical protein
MRFTAYTLTALTVLVLAGCGDGELKLMGNYPGSDAQAAAGNKATGPTEVTQGGKTLSVTKPAPGELVDRRALIVQGKTDGLEKVTVNGNTIPVDAEGAFSATVQFEEGDQLVAVEAEGLPPVFVPISVDLNGPIIQIKSPARGAFQVAGQRDMIVVEGAVTDAVTAVETITLNGQTVPVSPGGTFSVQVTPEFGANVLTLDATDSAGHKSSTTRGVVYGQFEPWGELAVDGVNTRLRADALGVLEQGFATALAGSVNSDLLGGGQQAGDFRVTGMSFESVELDLVPQNGYFDTTIYIYDLVIDIETRQTIVFIPVTITGDIRVNPAEIRTKLYINENGRGGLDVRLEGGDVSLHNFDLNLDGIAGIIDGLIEGVVEDLAVGLFSEAIAGIDVGDLLGAGGISVPLELFGQTAALDLYLNQFDIDPGGLTFAADTGLTLQPSPMVPPSPGTLKTPGAAPNNNNIDRMVRFSIGDDLVNGILGNLWNAGGLHIEDIGSALGGDGADGGGGIGLELNATTFALLVGPDILEYAPGDTKVGIRLNPLLPPVARMGGADGETMRVIIADMMLEFYLKPEGAAPIHFATMATTLDLGVNMGIVDGELDLGLTVNVIADLVEEPLFDIGDQQFETVIGSIFGSIPDLLGEGGLGDLLGGAGGGASPGGELVNTYVVVDGPNRDFMSFYTDVQ